MKPIKLKVKTNLDHYPIIIGSNLIRNLTSYLNENSIIFNQCLLVIDKKVPIKLINNITKALKRKKFSNLILMQVRKTKILNM
jgi:3-dehydroquinate synthetase